MLTFASIFVNGLPLSLVFVIATKIQDIILTVIVIYLAAHTQDDKSISIFY